MAEQDDKKEGIQAEPPVEPKQEETPKLEEQESEFPEETWVTDEDWVDDINVRWREVIKHLMDRKSIYDAYAKAYDVDISTPRGYNVAKAAGSRLLTNVNFRKLWNKVLAETGFNDEMADSVLFDLMVNDAYDPKVRRAALHDYNELRGRIIKNIDLKSGGKPIEAPAIMPAIEPRNDAPAQTETTHGS